MRRIKQYQIYYTPKAKGYVSFVLEGDIKFTNTPLLEANELTALASVLALENISFDPLEKTFSGTNSNDPTIVLNNKPNQV